MSGRSSFILLGFILSLPTAVAAEFEEHHRRTDGLLHRLRARVEKPDTEWIVRNAEGHRFTWDGKSLSTYLYDDNSSYAIPSTDESAFVEAQARAYEKSGLTDRALELYMSLQAMDGRYFKVDAAVRARSREAAERLHQIHTEFDEPLLVRDRDRLHIICDTIGLHLQLPVEKTDVFRLRRIRSERTRDRISFVLALSSGSRQFLLFADRFMKLLSSPDTSSYLVYSDLRKGLDGQRKRDLEFERICEKGICGVSFRERGSIGGWEELVMTNSGAGFLLTAFPGGDETKRFLRRVAETVEFEKETSEQ